MSSHQSLNYLFILFFHLIVGSNFVEGWLQQCSTTTSFRQRCSDGGRGSSRISGVNIPFTKITTASTQHTNMMLFSISTNNKDGIEKKDVKVDDNEDGTTVEEYRNVATKILSEFMQKDDTMTKTDTDDINVGRDVIDFQAPKISPSTSLVTLAAALDYELTEKEWFVSGDVNPSYFSEDFEFQDPDVKVSSIEDYSKGVRKIFNQSTSRAEILSTVVNEEVSTLERPVITCTWRLSGGVNIGFGLNIKPYIVYTDFTIDPISSLIIFQEDRFGLPSWDILLRCVV
ncbi:MAG: hypothetical protein ACI8RD_014859 [Bacillariaceae sp.]|jgi:hypothetical protein